MPHDEPGHLTMRLPNDYHPMTPWSLFMIFAWLSIIALAMTILSDFWLPMLIGAVVITLLTKLAR